LNHCRGFADTSLADDNGKPACKRVLIKKVSPVWFIKSFQKVAAELKNIIQHLAVSVVL